MTDMFDSFAPLSFVERMKPRDSSTRAPELRPNKGNPRSPHFRDVGQTRNSIQDRNVSRKYPSAVQRARSNRALARAFNEGRAREAPNLAALPEEPQPETISEADLLKKSPEDLVRIIMNLRKENHEMKLLNSGSESTDLAKKSATTGKSTVERESPLKTKGIISLVEEKLAQTESDKARLQEELARERVKSIEAEKRARRTLKELAMATKTESNPYDDNHFKDLANQLRYSVNNWARGQSWKVGAKPARGIVKLKANEANYNIFRSTCPHYMEYVENKRGMEALVEAHIWQFISREIFGHYIWAETTESKDQGVHGASNKPFWAWKDYLEDSVPHEQYQELLHEWRVVSARLMAGRDPEVVKPAIARATRKRTLDLTIQLRFIAEEPVDTFSLEELMHDAVKLDTLFDQQRPKYMFYPVFQNNVDIWKRRFNRSLMDLVDENEDNRVASPELEKQQVSLVIRPGLRKYGTVTGKNYDQGIPLLKTVVDVMDPK